MTLHDDALTKISSYDQLPSNRVIAAELLDDLRRDPNTDYEALVAQLLPLAVARAVSSTRTQIKPLAKELKKGSTTRYQPSPWVKHAQTARELILNEIYTDARQTRKRLALFTAEDLDALTQRLATKRDNLEAQRVRFDALKEAMTKAQVTCVEELSDKALAKALNR